MTKIALALIAFALAALPAHAEGDSSDIMSKLVNVPSAKSWSVLGLQHNPEEVKDDRVQGGIAIRVSVPGKGANPWDVAARVSVVKPVQKGDVILLAFWARAQAPAEGQSVAILPGIRVEETSPPYNGLAQDSANVTGNWAMYYASGVATKDYKPGALAVAVHMAAAKQTVDLGPVFVVDLGPDYDKSKLPHNKSNPASSMASSTSTPAPSAQSPFATDLAQLRARLPVQGVLLNDPAVTGLGAYGNDQKSEVVPAADVSGGQAYRITVTKADGNIYDAAVAGTIRGDIHKGDVIFVAYYARAASPLSAQIGAFNVQQNAAPYAVAVGGSATVPPGGWRMFYVSGVAAVDLPSGKSMLTAQVGGHKQAIEFGPVFVLNLGPGVALTSLPRN
jgi:hypothetical protein